MFNGFGSQVYFCQIVGVQSCFEGFVGGAGVFFVEVDEGGEGDCERRCGQGGWVLELWGRLVNLRLERDREGQGRELSGWSQCGKNTYNPQGHVEHGALEDVADLVADTWSECF